MSVRIDRRDFLAAAAGCAASALTGGSAAAAAKPLVLAATTRVLDIGGRPATVLGLLREDGASGLLMSPGERFRVALENRLDAGTIVHWHGQHPPIAQDGVPDNPLPLLAPGESRSFDFAPVPGTHWMHAHVPDQEMRLLAAPMIVRNAEDAAADRQEVVVMLHDFSFTPLPELLARLGAGAIGGMAHGIAAAPAAEHGGHGMAGMGPDAGAMDLNDIEFDAYLANDRTLADPEVVAVERGGRVLLRIINGAGATVFWVDTGVLQARLVAVDGHAVAPVEGRRFGLAMGQRIDLLVDVPAAGGAFPILALREGARERAGVVLATPGAAITRLALVSDAAHPAFGLAQEAGLRAATPLAPRRADRTHTLALTGAMAGYTWSFDDRPWGSHRPLTARPGERVEIAMINRTMMAHPIHLHGHAFQVVEIDGRRLSGALRDTVHVPAMARVTVALDAGAPARWMLHCHHMPHLATGMMTELAISA